jgi:geranylgeranyl diphosphate synthase type II
LSKEGNPMSTVSRVELTLAEAVTAATAPPCPPNLARALRWAVFPGGQRLRPRLCIGVAEACGDARPLLTNATAAAIELLHCASLVHDDLPCFDDAPIRRGRSTVHVEFGEPVAVLVGDALIVGAFDVVAQEGAFHPRVLPEIVRSLARGVGVPHGLVAGQGWESEPVVDLGAYHRAKTAALFEAAVELGARTGGGDPLAWAGLGARLGEAYQVADDLADVLSDPETIGKPIGQDAQHARPNAVEARGVDGATRHLRELLGETLESVPSCPGRDRFQAWLGAVTARLSGMTEAPALAARA